MANENNAPTPTTASRQGANSQRRASGTSAGSKSVGGRQKKTNAKETAAAEIAELKAKIAELVAANKAIEDNAARGGRSNSHQQPEEDITPLYKPAGEAGDKKNGFVLRTAMGLDDDEEMFEGIIRAVHRNVTRANLDVQETYRRQDPGKLNAVFKLTRKEYTYLTEKRFPLNWSTAEMVKQYLRNKRKYSRRRGYIPDFETTKRRRAEQGSSGSNKRRKTNSGNIRHINDDLDDDESDKESDKENDDELETAVTATAP